MKYDSDLIDAVYLLKQHDSQLAERIWNRLTKETKADQVNEDTYSLGYGRSISGELYRYMKINHNAVNKVAAIKDLREKTGWGLKEAKDAVDYIYSEGMFFK